MTFLYELKDLTVIRLGEPLLALLTATADTITAFRAVFISFIAGCYKLKIIGRAVPCGVIDLADKLADSLVVFVKTLDPGKLCGQRLTIGTISTFPPMNILQHSCKNRQPLHLKCS